MAGMVPPLQMAQQAQAVWAEAIVLFERNVRKRDRRLPPRELGGS
ncbi:MAG: hypothetical protein LZF62_260047 [Nitrospira sp.]|nr:MAG: hypothetical protein LZF62_260047 [Nitrospira sp.]